MHGDQVLVELGRIRPDGKGEGTILRVTEREQVTVVGTFHYGDRTTTSRPLTPRWPRRLLSRQAWNARVPKVKKRKKRTTTPPSIVIIVSPRPGVRGSRARIVYWAGSESGTWEDLENVVVEIEITQFPRRTRVRAAR